MSSRHSAIYIDKNARSSGIFNNRRGSDVGMAKKSTGEPVLMEFVKKTDSLTSANDRQETSIKDNNSLLKNFMRPRREKTESDIVLRHSEVRRSIRESLEARRRTDEAHFAKEVENIRRRSSRPLDLSSLNISNISTSSNSTAGDEFSFIQVIFGLFGLFFNFFRVLFIFKNLVYIISEIV